MMNVSLYMRKVSAVFLMLGFLVAVPASAQTVSSGYGYAQPTYVCPTLSYNLYRGLSDYSTQGQVSALQQYLASLGYSQPVTGYFGMITFANVASFQRQHTIFPVTGGVGPITRATIAQLCGGTSTSSYNFSASPSSGQAPLAVNFTMSTSITNTQSGQQYVVNFGDGQHDIMTQGSCIAITAVVGGQGGIRCNFGVPHTYQSPGTYTATLSPYIACMYSNPRCMIATQTLGQATVTVTGAQTIGGLTVTSPAAGQSYARGTQMTIQWAYPVTPGSTNISLDLYSVSSGRIGTIVISSNTAGSYVWSIPPFPNTMMCTMQYPNGLCGTNLAPGQYYIVASAYSATGLGSSGAIATGRSGVFTIN